MTGYRNILSKIRLKYTLPAVLAAYFLFSAVTYPFAKNLEQTYRELKSPVITDREGRIISLRPNARGYYSSPLERISPAFARLLLKKEDRFFYYHPGLNPWSIARSAASLVVSGKPRGSSTITQQLAKVLLANERERSFKNKIIEAWYALSLEAHLSKEEILKMYADSIYFGNRAQGLGEASRLYFNTSPELLDDGEIIELLASISNPSNSYPGSFLNAKTYPGLAALFGVTQTAPTTKDSAANPPDENENIRQNKTSFELSSLGVNCPSSCQLTIDRDLTENLREVLRRNLSSANFSSVENGAVVVIKLPENELLAVVGSPNPYSSSAGSQLNMAIEPRPVGSTAKPFIYLFAFQKGLRPYTLVDDREYKYDIGTGFPFYPKNYDGQYRGVVTLHQALSNSLNVPTVKVLEYAGAEGFYNFLTEAFGFKALQPYENYGLSPALGGLEVDLLTLADFFTTFPNQGWLKPLAIYRDPAKPPLEPPMAKPFSAEKKIVGPEITELVNKILSDRDTSIDQFGIKSNLNLPQKNYALKTGTTYNYHDSWTVGYTPDFLVGVWIGNSKNTPMRELSGQLGAGKIWHEAMEIMLNSPYNKKTPFTFSRVKEFNEQGSIEYGLAGDDYLTKRNLLKEPLLITAPHNGDTFLLESQTEIPLAAASEVNWFVNGASAGQGQNLTWHPPAKGDYLISAEASNGQEAEVKIHVRAE